MKFSKAPVNSLDILVTILPLILVFQSADISNLGDDLVIQTSFLGFSTPGWAGQPITLLRLLAFFRIFFRDAWQLPHQNIEIPCRMI